MAEGLSSAEAAAKLRAFGFNELPSAKPKTILHIALEVVKEPMFLLLISCAMLYMLLGDFMEGSILLFTTCFIIFITFYQYQRTEKALEALRKLTSPRALVIRNGSETRIPGREVVPGDILLLHEGDRVPADAEVTESVNLTVDESLLTGESVPVNKTVFTEMSSTLGQVFSGTLVVQGKGKAKVLHTGTQTQFGKIGTSLQNIEHEKTRMQKEMKVLIRNLFIIGGIISVCVVVVFYFTRGNFIHSLLNGLASAMAILPEEFPVVLTVFLALGAWRLSKKNVLTRNPSAIETLGSATVLCADKTGTITQNKMVVTALYDGNKHIVIENFQENKNHISALVRAAHRASQKDSIDPMEKAITSVHRELDPESISEYTLIKEYPLSRDLLAMTRVLEDVSDPSAPFSISAKGAPEAIFKLCRMSEAESTRHFEAVQQMAEQGYRVIAAAHVSQPDQSFPINQLGFNYEFLGLIGLEDPIRPEVPQAVKECAGAGVRVIMITGDFPATAKSIGQQIGLDSDKEMMTGEEMNRLSDTELRKKIERVSIVARVAPEQKLRIVDALKANNEIVAMTGDGVNDAPALKAADIGVAMGNKGTDVAREASSLVLLDDNFASIVAAIRSGRRIFDNLQKAMAYIVAIHIPIIGLALLPAFIPDWPLLLMPLHIVFMELIIDPVCSIAFESEQEEKNIMKRKPRNPGEQFFGGKKILVSAIQGLMLLTMVVMVYLISIQEGHSEGEVRAIAFSSLIIGNIFLILTTLSKTRSFLAVITEKNVAVMLILSLAVITLLLILIIPALQHIFSFEFPGYGHFVSSLSGAGIILLILEAVKYWQHNRSKNI